MTIIVTGGAGFIGANFIFHMLEAHPDYKIVCLDKLTYAGNLSTLACVMDEESNQKVRNFAADAVEKVKENIPVSISVDIKRDGDVVDAEVEEVHETDENK